MKSRYIGFSLIEVLVAVAIVGIVAAVAVPSYMDSVNKSNRVDAITDLNETVQRLQRCFTTFGRYDQPNPPGGCAIYQQLVAPAGIDTRKGFYNIILFNDGNDANNSFAFELRATVLAGRSQARDRQCQTFSINQAGVRASTDVNGLPSTDMCWR